MSVRESTTYQSWVRNQFGHFSPNGQQLYKREGKKQVNCSPFGSKHLHFSGSGDLALNPGSVYYITLDKEPEYKYKAVEEQVAYQ